LIAGPSVVRSTADHVLCDKGMCLVSVQDTVVLIWNDATVEHLNLSVIETIIPS